MFNYKFFFYLFILLIPLASSQLEIGEVSPSLNGVDILFPVQEFNNNTAFVNSSAFWVTTNQGPLSSTAQIDHDLLNNLAWSVNGITIDTFMDFNSNDISELNSLNFTDLTYINSSSINFININSNETIRFYTPRLGGGTSVINFNASGIVLGDSHSISYDDTSNSFMGSGFFFNIFGNRYWGDNNEVAMRLQDDFTFQTLITNNTDYKITTNDGLGNRDMFFINATNEEIVFGNGGNHPAFFTINNTDNKVSLLVYQGDSVNIFEIRDQSNNVLLAYNPTQGLTVDEDIRLTADGDATCTSGSSFYLGNSADVRTCYNNTDWLQSHFVGSGNNYFTDNTIFINNLTVGGDLSVDQNVSVADTLVVTNNIDGAELNLNTNGANITMFAPNSSEYECSVNNSGSFLCVPI